MKAQSIGSTRAVLTPEMGLALREVGEDFYQKLDADFGGFRNHVLVSQHEFSEAWPTWELHPKGDELVLLLHGDTEMALLTAGGEQTVDLREPGDYIVVPRNTWHTARPRMPTSMLFFTPGEGTLNEAVPKLGGGE